MKKTTKKPNPDGHARKKHAPVSGRSRLARVFTGPPLTVNSMLEWLNEKLGLRIPTLPLSGWPPILQSLWELLIPSSYPSGPFPWDISIDGEWPAIFPQFGSPPVMLENLTIHVQYKTWNSPD